jgi:hypothetical protein
MNIDFTAGVYKAALATVAAGKYLNDFVVVRVLHAFDGAVTYLV